MSNIAELLSTWVKYEKIRDKTIVICSKCLKDSEEWREITKLGDIVLLACPEQEKDTYFGKIATIIRCSKPRRIIVITREGSPHCYLLHAAINQALFITNEKILIEHYVVYNRQILKISIEAVQVSRYLHIVEKLIRNNPHIVDELRRVSLEASKLSNKSNL